MSKTGKLVSKKRAQESDSEESEVEFSESDFAPAEEAKGGPAADKSKRAARKDYVHNEVRRVL